jgi:hypothetical protein
MMLHWEDTDFGDPDEDDPVESADVWDWLIVAVACVGFAYLMAWWVVA